MKILNYNHYILNDGLIHTYPISIHSNVLQDNLLFLNKKGVNFKIYINHNNETLKPTKWNIIGNNRHVFDEKIKLPYIVDCDRVVLEHKNDISTNMF